MNRRGFLGAILVAGMAPAVAKSGVLMPVRPPGLQIVTYGPPTLMPPEIARLHDDVVDGLYRGEIGSFTDFRFRRFRPYQAAAGRQDGAHRALTEMRIRNTLSSGTSRRTQASFR